MSWNILGSAYWIQSIRKNDTRNFYLFVFYEVTTRKVNFRFYKQCSQAATRLRTCHFCVKCQHCVLALIFLYILKKKLVEKLCKVLDMRPKAYTLAGLKFYLKYYDQTTITGSIWQKVRKCSKIRQYYKNLIFNFAGAFLTAFGKIYFLKGRQRTGLWLHLNIS